MMAVRDGLQAGAGQCALVNNTPVEASRSRFGVCACGWPPRQPTQSLRSSSEINNTFGGDFSSALFKASDAISSLDEFKPAKITNSFANQRAVNRSNM